MAPDDGAADAVRRARPAWAVDSLACAVLPDLLAAADPAGWTAAVGRGPGRAGGRAGGHGWRALPSDSPVGARPRGGGAARTRWPATAVVVRDCTSFGLPGHVRVAVPDGEGLERLDAPSLR